MGFKTTCDLVKNESGVFPLTGLDAGESATLLFSEGDDITPEQIEEYDVKDFVCASEDLPYEVRALFYPLTKELEFDGVKYEAVEVETVVVTTKEETKKAEPTEQKPEATDKNADK